MGPEPMASGTPAVVRTTAAMGPGAWWPVLLAVIAGGGAGYLAAMLTGQGLRAELALRPPVILLDVAQVARAADPVALGAALGRQRKQAERLAAGGFLVLDAQAVIAAPGELYLAPEPAGKSAGDAAP
jgi:hypothetical protein